MNSQKRLEAIQRQLCAEPGPWAEALWSSSHGAGRQLSRAEAGERIRPRDLAAQMQEFCYDQTRARQLVDEAPGAYKDIAKVMKAQRELTRITSRLRPLLNHKGR